LLNQEKQNFMRKGKKKFGDEKVKRCEKFSFGSVRKKTPSFSEGPRPGRPVSQSAPLNKQIELGQKVRLLGLESEATLVEEKKDRKKMTLEDLDTGPRPIQ